MIRTGRAAALLVPAKALGAALLLTACTLDYGGLGTGGGGGGTSGTSSSGADATSASTSGGGAPAGGGAASGTSSTGAPSCEGSLAGYVDTFDQAGPGFWTAFNASVDIAGGAMTLTMAADAAGGIFRQGEARASGDGSPRGLPDGCAIEAAMPALQTAWGGIGIGEAGGDAAWTLWADGVVVELWASNGGEDVRVAQGNLASPEALRIRRGDGAVCGEAQTAAGAVSLGCFPAQGWETDDAVLLLTLEEKVSGEGGVATFVGVGPGT